MQESPDLHFATWPVSGYLAGVLILGAGAQKAGTTWLYKQLSKSPDFVSLDKKELHFWSKSYLFRNHTASTEIEVARWFEAQSHEEIGHDSRVSGREYFNYLKQVLSRAQGPHPFTTDLTPAYAGIPLFVWRDIRNELEENDIDYRIMFLMRDPVARVTSHLNMELRMNPSAIVNGLDFSEGADSNATAFARSWRAVYRTRYELTLNNLETVFPPEKVFIGFMERISSPSQVQELIKVLGFDLPNLDPSRRVNSSRTPNELSKHNQEAIANFYATTYREIRHRFPEVANFWPGFRFLENPI